MRNAISTIVIACLLAVMCGVFQAAAIQPQETPVTYEQFGAWGDGIHDDFDAICAAHAAANVTGQPVQGKPGAAYYIGPGAKTAVIQTDTDWGDAQFIIDDSIMADADRGCNVFQVTSKLLPYPVAGVTALMKSQTRLDLALERDAVVIATDDTTLRFIREGGNRNDGTAQKDVFIVRRNGSVDVNTPILWDYDNITAIMAYPIDDETLTVRGGHFTTIANQSEGTGYYSRGLGVSRSNVMVEGFTHAVTGETEYGAPYRGFIDVTNCADVTVKNCMLSGHKTYQTIGSAGTVVSMGTYDINVNTAVNVAFLNCKQLNDMFDGTLWGIMGSNFCKNLEFDSCELSRFDAHMGTANAAIRNSMLRTISVTGFGLLRLENTKVTGNTLISLRSDYGSFWDGEVEIYNCELVSGSPAVISSRNSEQHDFGYPCMMPKKITIDGLLIDDTSHKFFYFGPHLFDHYNPNFGFCRAKYPYAKTGEVTIKNLTVKSGRCLIKSRYWFTLMLRGMKVIRV